MGPGSQSGGVVVRGLAAAAVVAVADAVVGRCRSLPAADAAADFSASAAPQGSPVQPGTYFVRLTVGGQTLTSSVDVLEDIWMRPQ